MDPVNLTLEYPLFKVAYEQHANVFRSMQKSVEREVAIVNNSLKKLAANSNLSAEAANKSITALLKRLDVLKEKLSKLQTADEVALGTANGRLEHVRGFDEMAKFGPEGEDSATRRIEAGRMYSGARLDRVLGDYMLREGYFNSAAVLGQETGLSGCLDTEVYESAVTVLNGLGARDAAAALAWCTENRARLKKMNSDFEFRLRLQEFVELVRKRDLMGAISYARQHVAAMAVEDDGARLEPVQEAMACLAWPGGVVPEHSDTGSSLKYAQLFAEDAWEKLAVQFRAEVFALHSMPEHSLLEVTLQPGLAALKTPMCYNEDDGTRNINCPVCAPAFNELAKDLPFAHHLHSSLVCRISGKIMDDNNPPMVLPNGSVYSRQALEEMSLAHDGLIKDQRTGDVFQYTECRKAFIS